MTCPHANISLPTTSDPDTVCVDCGEILQNSSTEALPQTEKQSTLSAPAARCSRETNQQGAMTMSKMTEAATISSAIATSISEDRTVDVRVPVEAIGNLDWIEDLVEGVEDFDYAKDSGVENEPGECTYDVWGTTEDGDEFRLSICEYVDG